MFTIVAMIALAFGVWTLWRNGHRAIEAWLDRIDTKVEMERFFADAARAVCALAVVVTSLRVIFFCALVIVVTAALSPASAYDFCGDRYCPQGGAYAKPVKTAIDVSTARGRKLAAGIARRPNVVADRPVPKAGAGGRTRGTVIVLRGMGGYLPFGGMDALGAKIRAKGYRVIVSAPDYWAAYRNERPAMIVGCSLGGTNALELARAVKNRPRVITIDPTRANRGAPRGIAAINLYNSRNVLGAGHVRGAANYENNIGHIAMCSAAPIHAVVLAHL